MGENVLEIVKSETYGKMLSSSIALRDWIRHKHKHGLTVTKEEADFVNDFEVYVSEVVEIMKSQEAGGTEVE